MALNWLSVSFDVYFILGNKIKIIQILRIKYLKNTILPSYFFISIQWWKHSYLNLKGFTLVYIQSIKKEFQLKYEATFERK